MEFGNVNHQLRFVFGQKILIAERLKCLLQITFGLVRARDYTL